MDRDDDEKDAGGTLDRKEEKDNFDGTPNTLDTKSVSAPSDAPHSEKGKRERDLTNRPATYNSMGVQGEHSSDETKVPGRILDRKIVKVFHFETRLVEEHSEMIKTGLAPMKEANEGKAWQPKRYRSRSGSTWQYNWKS